MYPYVTLKKYGENTSQLYCTNCQKKPWIFRNDVVPTTEIVRKRARWPIKKNISLH